ncbi:1,4-dihydroxy-2-naphthoate octaprenyltransferase [Hanamia caeni]|jgi:1,4-dihydroxy-2-naphthoate octaprenyltransferase|uniref:1,4-dihydroxy-2-naphthoate octaprenyltransferase n=2 Tax=Hanamia caeni TaxID=2294116 RepID=A0A3M9NN58_9BACT|nr:1,4-dihydroxy-2-naphthoate octaprenyltransferase [Hanamia caeni]
MGNFAKIRHSDCAGFVNTKIFQPMAQRTKQEVLDYLSRAEVAAVGTSNMGTPRQRMMHFGADDDFNIYVSSMKGDPKVIQWSNIPETALLIHQGKTFLEMEECEIIGRAEIIRDKQDREKALRLMTVRSPIVANFAKINATDRLEFIRIKPFVVKYRFVPEILQGEKPTIFEFPENRESFSTWDDLKAKARAWKEAVRPLSLTASLIPLLLGGAIAFYTIHTFNIILFLLTLIGGVMIQAGTNMINDWKDAERDNENVEGIRPFTGGSRMIQLGLVSRSDMGFFGFVLCIVSFLIGAYLVAVTGWGLVPLIFYGLFAGLFYTGEKGKFSFINLAPGIAEFLIATTFGVMMTMGAFYVQTGFYSLQAFLISLPVAIFISNVLLINQFQDAASDMKSDKNTLVVRLGKRKAKNILIGCFIVAYAIIAILPLLGYAPYTFYVAFLSVPFAVQAIRYAQRNYDKNSADLVPSNAHTAITHLFTGLLLVFAFLLTGLGFVFPSLYMVASLLLVFWVWHYIERQRKTMTNFRMAIGKK